jgi:translation initiation factor 2 beta subunit (eIF-2beta)/eIF-5
MKRSDEHVTQFLFAELGTSGSVDGSKRLVIKGRYVKPHSQPLSSYSGPLMTSSCLILVC